ncbi:MAG: DUF333 domain-containing protein [Anaerolineales bacterium]
MIDSRVGVRLLWMAALAVALVACRSTAAEPAAQASPSVVAAPSATPENRATVTAGAPSLGESAPVDPDQLDGLRVVGYAARVSAGPSGTASDDIVQFLPEGLVPVFAVAGADDDVEEKLAAARELTGAEGSCHLYGTFECGVGEVRECRLVVDKVLLPTEQSDPEPVTGLQGHIVSLGDDGAFDDKLVLTGPLPIELGITSAVFENGYPLLDDELAALRDTGAVVSCDGQIVSGVDDVNRVQLQVSAASVDGEAIDPLDHWLTHEEPELGLRFRYPPGARVARDGAFVSINQGDVSLVIGSRRRDQEEAITWGRTESLKPIGQALILGQWEAKLAWEVDGRLLGIRYGATSNVRDGGELQRGKRLLTASLWQLGDDWFAKGDLPAEAQMWADIVLSTLELTEEAEGESTATLPNPASAHCVEQGGELEIRTDAEGGQYGVCLFADGSECEEWAFYRGECAPTGEMPEATIAPPSYVHPTMGWGLSVPADWSLSDGADYVLLSREVDGRSYLLFVGARATGTTEPAFGTGLPEGELQPGGQIDVFDYALARHELVFEGKVKVISYDIVRSGGLEFVCRLDAVQREGQTYADLDIPAEVQDEADAIVSSLTFVR